MLTVKKTKISSELRIVPWTYYSQREDLAMVYILVNLSSTITCWVIDICYAA